jgi:NAD+ synthase
MSTSFTLALAQLNPIVGDVSGNADKAYKAWEKAASEGADLIMLPEMFLSGYPIEDLALRPAFVAACHEACISLAQRSANGPAMLIGLPWAEHDKIHNAYALLDEGRVQAVRFKVNLPNYGVFDEKRVFEAGPLPKPVSWRGLQLGLPICEDIWNEEVITALAERGADLLLSPNGSPYWRGKRDERHEVAQKRVSECGLPLVYLNQVGGQDELVFDGASFIVDGDGALKGQLPAFEEAVTLTFWAKAADQWTCAPLPSRALDQGDKADYAAAMLGLRDYVRKNHFNRVVLGLSGGIDSALCAALAVDALGAEHVHCVMLPYVFTAQESLNDAAACAAALGVRYDVMPIHQAVEGLRHSLMPLQSLSGVTLENLQSRARGTLLMALSNASGAMLVTTGNKSEMAVGYATLYGDMNGGFNPIKDLYKMKVFALSKLRNEWKPLNALGPDGLVIPEKIITKPPSAELRDNQKDEDSLPPYPVLDGILHGLIEEEASLKALIARGFAAETVQRIAHLLNKAEYKRRQSAPGVKVTRKNFGRDRRYPIINRFEENI